MKTTKQIADELGVSKQKVYRYIKAHNIKEARQENGVMYYDDADEYLIKQGFEAIGNTQQKAHRNTSNEALETLVEVLRSELATKNNQIAALQQQNEQLTNALQATTESLKASQALHAGTMQQQLEAPEQKQKRGVFSWLKRKT